jgi:superfamily II DNA or RNA helicase
LSHVLHAIGRRYCAEDLIRLRRADEQRRFLASQRSGRVDPNPHQIDAVIFALQRIGQGGCILADEVGLGKTIEAGLVIAQLLAEGAQRILLVTPKPLLGQWREELVTLFGIDGREGAEHERGFVGSGVFLVGREHAGSERGAEALAASGRFDLCVIDEAHEIFAGIYRRYDRHGDPRTGSRYARMASRVKQMLGDTPVLLLTATPIQNTLTELWGLVQYVEPTGALLGDLPTFRTLFCESDDRRLRPGQGDELRRRIATVCQRTLRRQAEAFMDRPFTRRTARMFEYSMSPEELALYDEVTAYLLDPKTAAFRGAHRRLLTISFHRRMGSSVAALAGSLETVAQRLDKKLRGTDGTLRIFADDLEDEVAEEDLEEEPELPPVAEPELLAERARVQRLATQARTLVRDSKAERLVDAVRFVLERANGSGKVVVFTEALTTQDYLRELLVSRGVLTDEQVTIFRGQNTGARAQQALERWEAEVGAKLPREGRPSRGVATRLALVHEFATRSNVFIATEAGAKGLNLQFCENVINYDLPWNPQRIEQRIGRCHRYGQTRDVTVINFVCLDNAAQRLTFEILTRKLDLFGTVLDASDAVLYEPSAQAPEALVGALAGDFEALLEEVYSRARSQEEIEAGLVQVDARIGEARDAFEDTHRRTAGVIETRFDETVRAAFKRIADELPEGLAAFDREVEGVVRRWLDAIGVPYLREEDAGQVRLKLARTDKLPEGYRDGVVLVVGRRGGDDEGEPVHLGHRLLREAIEEARRSTRARQRVRVEASSPSLRSGTRGRLFVLEVRYGGFEPMTDLVPVIAFEDGAPPLLGPEAVALVLAAMHDANVEAPVPAEAIEDATDEALFVARAAVEEREQQRFEEAIERIERSIDDRILVLRRTRADLANGLEEARTRRDASVGADRRTAAEADCRDLEDEIEALDREIDRLRRRDDDKYLEWRFRAHARRYAAPACERILEAEFEIA